MNYLKRLLNRMKYKPMIKINVYSMQIHTASGASVCTPDGIAIKQRIERLKREMRMNK
ncbi:hypothetical protein AsFcp4_208 [Aeromonas phage AsFcp_4]|uniref:Uncharacterized protein n=1 Tax=Aeromonas phage PX29 TaxID=926067 RepID=E5DPY3_9CAUD|nr:hypothetical protein CL89_gp050 [Aeromonas phage PX29]ADQ52769.1 conserved hypothetical protein [Aeromonas phage PX29]QAX98629.1 hypothetical protein ASfcp2_296 [Aeromonas phage AsFcp_2]QAX99661.1 hypothetical protein AsFcp4_208 [Aeromonas phage AsFcp_4]